MISKRRFQNMIRSLWNIDRFMVPELSNEKWPLFRDDPVSFFVRADELTSEAIWREVVKRQSVVANPTFDLPAFDDPELETAVRIYQAMLCAQHGDDTYWDAAREWVGDCLDRARAMVREAASL